MNFIDVHTHLHDHRIIDDIPCIINRAESAGLRFLVTCATMEENFEGTRKLSEQYNSVLPCFGVHPWFLDTLSCDWETNLGEWLEKMPSGIGETGLDFMARGADRDLQISVFKAHLALADDLNRPINIHIRKAWDVFIHILKQHGPLRAGGLVHSYSGSADLVRVLVPYNLYISFSGSVTRYNAKKTVRALNAVSLDRILFETDTPDIFPTLDDGGNYAGRLNEPGFVPAIVKIAAERRGIGFEELAEHGYINGLKLFNPLLEKG